MNKIELLINNLNPNMIQCMYCNTWFSKEQLQNLEDYKFLTENNINIVSTKFECYECFKIRVKFHHTF
jgi:hypothetical protein